MKTGKRESGTFAVSCAPLTTLPETSAKMGSSRCSSVWEQGEQEALFSTRIRNRIGESIKMVQNKLCIDFITELL